jgi:hypothetical protein
MLSKKPKYEHVCLFEIHSFFGPVITCFGSTSVHERSSRCSHGVRLSPLQISSPDMYSRFTGRGINQPGNHHGLGALGSASVGSATASVDFLSGIARELNVVASSGRDLTK